MQVSTAATLQKGNYVIFQNVYIYFFNLDKVILLMIKNRNVQGQHG